MKEDSGIVYGMYVPLYRDGKDIVISSPEALNKLLKNAKEWDFSNYTTESLSEYKKRMKRDSGSFETGYVKDKICKKCSNRDN